MSVTVTSHVAHRPSRHGMRVRPSGRFPSDLRRPCERHGGAVGSALGIGLKHPSSKLGRDNCVEALSPHRVTAVGKLLTLNCLGGDWPSFTFILTLLSSDCVCQLSLINEYYLFIYLMEGKPAFDKDRRIRSLTK